MDVTQLLILVLYILSLTAMLSLSVLLLASARQSAKRFIILLATLTVWLSFQFIAQYFPGLNDQSQLLLIKLSLLFAGLVSPALYFFIRERVGEAYTNVLAAISYISPILGVVCAIMPIAHIKAQISGGGIAVSSDRPFYYLLTYSVLLSFLTAILVIRYNEKKLSKLVDQHGLASLRTGLTIALSMNVIGAVFLSSFEWSQVLTPLSMATLAIIIYVAVFKHGLFDVRVLVARSSAYLLSLVAMILLFALGAFILFNLLFKDAELSRAGTQAIYTILAIFSALIFPNLKRFFDKTTNRLFFRDNYDSQAFIDAFNKVVVTHFELATLLHKSSQIIVENLKSEYCLFGLRESTTRPQKVFSTAGAPKFSKEDIAYVRSITPHMRKKIIITDNLDQKHIDLQQRLLSNNIAVIARLTTANEGAEGIGYLILGAKKNGHRYSNQDIRVIEILANELVIAIQNALRTEEIQNFNITLQQKVTEATRKLRNTNEKLRALDEAKDDFVSMASHQLRTPLTSIKGYTSMVLEGDAGKINATQRKLLEQSFVSSQRMVYLIADLLNVSRLKTGKFMIESGPVNLAEVVQQELGQLQAAAAARFLTLTYNKPDSFPTLMLDETKTRQVIMNFVDNAVYYTPAGGNIEVKLVETPASVELRVVDTGIGVPKSEQPHLFTKFYRAGNARKARPDGTGLGLFMAKKVIVAEGGAIIFDTIEGKGSTFGFMFSKSKLAAASTPAIAADAPAKPVVRP